jgi:hypothetical protein
MSFWGMGYICEPFLLASKMGYTLWTYNLMCNLITQLLRGKLGVSNFCVTWLIVESHGESCDVVCLWLIVESHGEPCDVVSFWLFGEPCGG